MQLRTARPIFSSIRRDELREERVHDGYKMAKKPGEPAVCTSCGAVFHRGRWQWSRVPPDSTAVTCSACRRARDHFPAGFVHIGGEYFAKHRDEVLQLLRHREATEKADHPMARIIDIEERPTGVEVTTTDIHLARNLGRALLQACQGVLRYHYNRADNHLRVTWER